MGALTLEGVQSREGILWVGVLCAYLGTLEGGHQVEADQGVDHLACLGEAQILVYPSEAFVAVVLGQVDHSVGVLLPS